jgi:large subunit ribosomal protein L7/L12
MQKETAHMATAKKLGPQELLDQFEQMNLLEVSEFVKAFEERFGVTAAAPVAVAAGPAAGPAVATIEAPAEEQTEFTVTLTNVGQQKINVIKAVREITQLGLKEAKALVDEAPKPVVENVPRERADEVRAKLADAGAEAEIT